MSGRTCFFCSAVLDLVDDQHVCVSHCGSTIGDITVCRECWYLLLLSAQKSLLSGQGSKP
jgi:hypothetical protein